jgi:hypothetical protein
MILPYGWLSLAAGYALTVLAVLCCPACGSLVFWFKTVKILHAPDSRRPYFCRFGDNLFPFFLRSCPRRQRFFSRLFAGSYYYFLSTYIIAKRASDFAGLLSRSDWES